MDCRPLSRHYSTSERDEPGQALVRRTHHVFEIFPDDACPESSPNIQFKRSDSLRFRKPIEAGDKTASRPLPVHTPVEVDDGLLKTHNC